MQSRTAPTRCASHAHSLPKPLPLTSLLQTLHVVPYGAFDPRTAPDLDAMATYAQAFFGVPVTVLDAVPESSVSRRARTGCDGQRQLHACDILDHISGTRLPRDSFCCVGVTMTDIFPREAWNYVFGLARAMDGAGVYSFARYDPDEAFFSAPRELSAAESRTFMRRCLKVFLHETLHLLGLKHCVFANCLMRGSNHLGESDRKPVYLCPVCLRKLHAAVPGLDLLKRYQDLHTRCAEMGEWAFMKCGRMAPGFPSRCP